MTKEEIDLALDTLSLVDKAWIRRRLQDKIYLEAGRLHQQSICLHPPEKHLEVRVGDRLVKTMCRCGAEVSYRGD